MINFYKFYLTISIYFFTIFIYSQTNLDSKTEKIPPTENTEIEDKKANLDEKSADKIENPDKLILEKKKKVEEHHTEVKIEISSDFIRRGWALGTEDISRRNNSPYKSFQPVWAFQPTIEFPTPIKHLYAEVFFNIWMVDRTDRDNEKRVLQEESGGPELYPRFFSDLQKNNFCPTPSSCYDPFTVNKYKSQNGMGRNDAGEFTLFYDFEKTRFGRIKTGAYRYVIIPTSGSGGLSKTQIYVSLELPFFEFLNPKISIYKTINFRNQGTPATGLNRSALYIPLELSHEFMKDKFFRITPGTSIGYMYQANPIDKTSGFSDISSYIKFNFGKFNFTANYVKRPDIHLWDNNNYFDGATRLVHNGEVQDPSKLFGWENNLVYDIINANTPANSVERIYLKEKYNGQKIVTNFYYISFGYTQKF